MKIALIGDLHLGIKGGDKAFFDFQMDYIEYFINKCKELGVGHIVQLGDTFDNRKATNNLIMHGVQHSFIPLLKQLPVKYDFIQGNHDSFYRDNNSVTPLSILKSFDDFIDIVQETKETVIGGKRFLFCGWMNKNNTDDITNKIKTTKADYILGHFEPKAVPMYSNSALPEYGLDVDVFKNVKQVFSGHYHTVSVTKNYVSVGSPYHLNWGDWIDGTNRGFFTLDTETDEIDFIQNDESQSLFHVFDYDNIKKYKESDLEMYKNKIVKIFIKDKSNAKNFKDFKALVGAFPFIDYVMVDETITESQHIEIDQKTLELDTAKVFEKYIDKQDVTLDKTILKNLAVDIYNESIQNGD